MIIFLPWLYLKSVSTGKIGEALQILVGSDAQGLPANTVSPLKQAWSKEHNEFRSSDLFQEEWMYIWADGIYSELRDEQAKLCALVVIDFNDLAKVINNVLFKESIQIEAISNDEIAV